MIVGARSGAERRRIKFSRSAPCNISFASVPFFLEYEEPLTNSISLQQISRSAPCNISFATVPE